MSKVTIEKIFKDEKDGQYGKRLQVSLKVRESKVADINGAELDVAGKYIRGFFPANFTVPFTEGEQVDLLIIQKGEYFNFSIPGVGKAPTPDVGNLASRVTKLEKMVAELMGSKEEIVEEIDLDPGDDY